MAVAGFVIALVGLVFYFLIAVAVGAQAMFGGGYGLGIFWLILCATGTLLSVLGMMKLGKTGGKKGLAIAGMIIGILATIMTLFLVMGIGKIHEVGGNKLGEAMENLENLDTAAIRQSLESAIENATDSTAH
jgi:hypothetical protein